MTNDKRALNFIASAFFDYTASRFLLINNHPLNGIILASTAIEKYLKALSIIATGKYEKGHFDKFEKLLKVFVGTPLESMFNSADPQFFDALSGGYQLRYFDNTYEIWKVSFVTKQVLAELDYFINEIEKWIVVSDGVDNLTTYKMAVRNNDTRIYDNNYVLNNWDKKTFVETESNSFALFSDPANSVIELVGSKLCFPYSGRMTTFIIQIEGQDPIATTEFERRLIEAKLEGEKS